MKPKENKPQIAIYQMFGDEQKIRVRIENENVIKIQLSGISG